MQTQLLPTLFISIHDRFFAISLGLGFDFSFPKQSLPVFWGNLDNSFVGQKNNRKSNDTMNEFHRTIDLIKFDKVGKY